MGVARRETCVRCLSSKADLPHNLDARLGSDTELKLGSLAVLLEKTSELELCIELGFQLLRTKNYLSLIFSFLC